MQTKIIKLSLVSVVCIAVITPVFAQESPFMITGLFFDLDCKACNGSWIHITNLNTSVCWDARNSSNSNYYQLRLNNGDADIGNILQFDVPGCSRSETANHTVTQEEMDDGGIYGFRINKVHDIWQCPYLHRIMEH